MNTLYPYTKWLQQHNVRLFGIEEKKEATIFSAYCHELFEATYLARSSTSMTKYTVANHRVRAWVSVVNDYIYISKQNAKPKPFCHWLFFSVNLFTPIKFYWYLEPVCQSLDDNFNGTTFMLHIFSCFSSEAISPN